MDEIKIRCANDYQICAAKTDIYNDLRDAVLGFAGESGELCGKISKVFRDHEGRFSTDDRNSIKAECGDALWQLSCIINRMGWDLQAVMEENVKKLQDRAARGVLHGSGDNR